MPTVSKRCAHCQATRTRYSIDVTALRRPVARAGCADFPCYHEHAFPLEEFQLHTESSGGAPPDAFGRFRVLHQIGAGTLGPVFRAHDAVADRPVAVKLFTLDLSPERVQQLVLELQRLVGVHLAHPALSAPVAAGLQGGSAYLVSEFVAADSLDLVIREYGAAPPNDALRVAAQLAGALDFANAVQVRHGALHPRDVLLSSDETRLTGVGVAQALEAIGMGAPVRRPYTPSELIAAGDWGRRSDIFSLAALTHELLWARRITGTGSRAVENLTPIQGADLNALRTVFARALAEEPSERFETALAFADALRGAFSSGVAQSAPVVNAPVADDSDADASRILPQAAPAPKSSEVRPPAERRPAAEEKKPKVEDRRPVIEPQLPLLDRQAEVDLPIKEIARAENDRYRDVEMVPSIVPPPIKERQPAAAAQDSATPASRYLDYVRDDQPVPAAAPDLPIAPPIVVRPTLPEPTIRHEAQPPSRVPLVLALLVGLLLGFGAGYGVGLRQTVQPAAAPASAETTPPPGREFTESPVPDAPKPSPAAGEPPAPAASTDARATPPAPAPAAAPAPPPEADGRVLVRTSPAGARVFVDGREYGVSPFAVRNLAHGAHNVRVVRDGYNAEERRVVLTASQPSQSLAIDLERQGGSAPATPRGAQAARPAETGSSGGFTGDLVIASSPPGAAVSMDGKPVGTTPVTLRAVPIGSHVIRLEHEGYRLWSSAVRVVASQQNRITASLEK